MIWTYTKLAFCICLFSLSKINAAEPHPMTPASKNDLLGRGYVPHDDFVIITTPKCGSHYLMSLMQYLVNRSVDEGYDWVTQEVFSKEKKLEIMKTLRSCKNRNVVHKVVIPYFPEIERTFVEAQHKYLFLTRDPRDALISLLFHMEDRKSRGDRRDFMVVDSITYNTLSLDNKITALMTGSCCQNYMTDFYKPMQGWAKSPYGLAVRFEDLVGAAAKGSSEIQLATLAAIADYLDCDITLEELEAVALYAYSPWAEQQIGSKVHERGQIGSWKKFFKNHHKNIFKQLYGADLILWGYEKDYDW